MKKLYPDYVKFTDKFGFGDEKVILDSIEYMETFLKEETLNHQYIKTLIDNIEEIIPDTDNFSEIEASFALNASVSILELLNYLLDKDIIHIIDISNLMFDTIDFRIHDEIKDISDIEIDNHPLFLAEMESQLNFYSNNNA